MTRLQSDSSILKNKLMPKLEISKLFPIKWSVKDSVSALITKRNRPRDKIVTGNVNRIKIGFTIIFNNDSTILAPIAASTPEI